MTESYIPLTLPPAPLELCRAEVDFAEADKSLQRVTAALQARKARISFSGKPVAKPEEIAAAESEVDRARSAHVVAQKRRDRLRREYEKQSREALNYALGALGNDVRASVARLTRQLAHAKDLRRQAAAAGISLGDPLLSHVEKLDGILGWLRSAVEALERR